MWRTTRYTAHVVEVHAGYLYMSRKFENFLTHEVATVSRLDAY